MIENDIEYLLQTASHIVISKDAGEPTVDVHVLGQQPKRFTASTIERVFLFAAHSETCTLTEPCGRCRFEETK